jgi:hypothetical protein
MADNSSPDNKSLFLQSEERWKQEEERRKQEEEEGSRKKREGSTLKMKEDARKRDGSWPNHAGTRLKSAPVGQLSWNSYTTATTFSPDH